MLTVLAHSCVFSEKVGGKYIIISPKLCRIGKRILIVHIIVYKLPIERSRRTMLCENGLQYANCPHSTIDSYAKAKILVAFKHAEGTLAVVGRLSDRQ